MARLAVYESAVVSVVYAGLSLGDGRADPFLKLTANGPAYIVEGPGADGHIARCATNNDLYVVELSFKGTSSEHAKLSALHIADRKARNGAGIAPLVCLDANGSTIIQCAEAWIEGFPEQAFGVNKPDVTWTLYANIPVGGFLLGGN